MSFYVLMTTKTIFAEQVPANTSVSIEAYWVIQKDVLMLPSSTFGSFSLYSGGEVEYLRIMAT